MVNSDKTLEEQAQRLADYIIAIDLEPVPLPPEYFYASLPLCVIDAVFSIGVSYTSTRNTVVRYCKRQNWTRTLAPDAPRARGERTIVEFLALFDGLAPDQMADELFGNRQRTSTRSGILKAEAVQRFASALKEFGIDDFEDMTGDRPAAAEKLVRGIPGQGSGISFDYFRMLAGDDNLIKPDRMVQRLIARAIDVKPDQVTPDLARTILKGAIPVLAERGAGWSPRQLDYAIWERESSGPAK
uniref:hypothetical protein n=1 Tax=Pararhizobium sp. IMCC3301 TaxID=3067904 RepID=UPI00274289BA|nr:hypothetical protein [Pararhizobium sp. IMCC3301]